MLKKTLLKAVVISGLNIIAALTASANAVAASPGFYLGVQGGWSHLDYNESSYSVVGSNFVTPTANGYTYNYVSNTGSTKKSGFGGRPYIGYQFNDYVAIEGGYTWYEKNKLTDSGASSFYDYSASYSTASGTIKQQAVDVVAKGILPLEDGFGLYVKGGGAYVKAKESSSATVVNSQVSMVLPASTSSNSTISKWRPVAGAGISYDFNEMVTADVSWTRIFRGSGIANSDLAAVGVSYHFG